MGIIKNKKKTMADQTDLPAMYDAAAEYKAIIDSIPFGVNYSTPSETTTVPFTADAAQAWTQRTSFTSIKIPDGILSYSYTLGWVVQTTTDQVFAANIMGASWWSPKWVKAAAADYATYVCAQTFKTGSVDAGTNNIRQSTTQYIENMASAKGSALATQGTTLAAPSD